ncbi:MAG: hypothetical protein J7M40_05715 [Planctomycetes bacterium]|nr:hypothetical protein [Planctomycetota bacterium]
MNTKNYLIAWIAVIGLVLAAPTQAKPVPGRGPGSIGGRPSSVSRGHSSIGSRYGSHYGSIGRSHGSIGGSHISIGSRHSGISFRLGFGGSGLYYRTSIIPRLGHIYRRPVILPPRPTVVVPRPVVVQDPTVTVWISNANGSQSPVVLTQDGPWYIGPRGERYFGMPTAEQLRAAYGLNYNTVAIESADVVVYITAANGARIPVKLIATADGYIGPKGELYIEMPTEQQLRMIYGK